MTDENLKLQIILYHSGFLQQAQSMEEAWMAESDLTSLQVLKGK